MVGPKPFCGIPESLFKTAVVYKLYDNGRSTKP